MGLFYTSITLRGSAQASVAAELAYLRRTAYVSPTINGITVVYDREGDEDYDALDRLTRQLAAFFGCPALETTLHDDDLFWYCLYRDGQHLDRYDSTPDYFSDTATESLPPSGGDAALLCAVFGAEPQIAQVDRLLHYFMPAGADGDELLPEERHHGIVAHLGLPPFAAGIGYDWFMDAINEATALGQGFVKVAPIP